MCGLVIILNKNCVDENEPNRETYEKTHLQRVNLFQSLWLGLIKYVLAKSRRCLKTITIFDVWKKKRDSDY